jgi:hypothetical protein
MGTQLEALRGIVSTSIRLVAASVTSLEPDVRQFNERRAEVRARIAQGVRRTSGSACLVAREGGDS